MDTEKLKDIKARIKDLKTSKFSNSKIQQEISPFTIAVDLVLGTMIGVVIGIFTDKFFNSKPLFLIIFTIMGMIAGFNIIRQKVNNKK
ncbi:AtpZ/AtpI family protein [Rickettsia endosymbiont of Cantharis rufa]|uniref:AtpZ/AtpI family protein n=1 Tax=Rickettsia endosymbiont of Cantharis rufa TaxID=3066248 RepID=UPI0031334537